MMESGDLGAVFKFDPLRLEDVAAEPWGPTWRSHLLLSLAADQRNLTSHFSGQFCEFSSCLRRLTVLSSIFSSLRSDVYLSM